MEEYTGYMNWRFVQADVVCLSCVPRSQEFLRIRSQRKPPQILRLQAPARTAATVYACLFTHSLPFPFPATSFPSPLPPPPPLPLSAFPFLHSQKQPIPFLHFLKQPIPFTPPLASLHPLPPGTRLRPGPHLVNLPSSHVPISFNSYVFHFASSTAPLAIIYFL